MTKSILSITANPSIDKIAVVDDFQLGKIHRPKQLVVHAGGKGVNVARAITLLGGHVSTCLILGGHSGKWLNQDLEREGIPSKAVWVNEETRTCLSILDDKRKDLTEIYESSSPISKPTWQSFESQIDQMLPQATFMTLSGSLPVGAPPDGYARLITMAKKREVSTFLDASGQSLKLAIEVRPYAIKINRQEAGDLLKREIKTVEDSAVAARAINEFCQVAIITLGAKGAVLATHDQSLHFLAPIVQAICSVGSGDSFLGAVCKTLLDGESLIEAVRVGVATGAANTQVIGAGLFDRTVVDDLKQRVLTRKF